jgi:hypothetical protein
LSRGVIQRRSGQQDIGLRCRELVLNIGQMSQGIQ